MHSNRNLSPALAKATSRHAETFFFQRAFGACPICHGLGQKMVFDESLVVPDVEKSLEQGRYFRGAGRQTNGGLLQGAVARVTAHYQQNLGRHINAAEDFKRVLLRGSGEAEIEFTFWRVGRPVNQRPFEGVVPTWNDFIRRARVSSRENRLKRL